MINLNLGCGKIKIPGFIGIDMDFENGPDLVGLVDDLEAFEDQGIVPNSVSTIIAYDIIEHFDRLQYKAVLKNWFDHMAPGGRLYIRTNDLDRMIRLYETDPVTFPAEKFVWHLMCEHERPGMGHKWCFTKQMLFSALINVGFKKVEITPEDRIDVGDYFESHTTCDHCNMHMVATKTEGG